MSTRHYRNFPTFKGEFSEWNQFYSQFRSIIHENLGLTDLQQFQRLRGALLSPADKIIQHLELTDANYTIALELLKQRYNQPNRLLLHHAENILSLPPLTDRSTDLRAFLDDYNQHLNSLKSITSDRVSESIHTVSLLSKLTVKLKDRFQSSRSGNPNFPTPEEIIAFLTKHVQDHEAARFLERSKPHSPEQNRRVIRKPVSLITTSKQRTCLLCSGLGHDIYKCPDLHSKTVDEREKIVRRLKLCFNCLGVHTKAECKSSYTCKHCKQAHHSLLHRQLGQRTSSPQASTPSHSSTSVPANPTPHIVNATTAGDNASVAVLPTALVKLYTTSSTFIVARALLDSASTTSIITSRCCQVLQARRTHSSPPIMGIGASPTKTSGATNLNIATIDGTLVARDHPFIIMNQIKINTPGAHIARTLRPHLRNLSLADPDFDRRAPIDVLLGCDVTACVILGPAQPLGLSLPYAVPTQFGHVIMGQAPTVSLQVNPNYNQKQLPRRADLLTAHVIHQVYATIESSDSEDQDPHLESDDNLHKLVSRFWELESVPDTIKHQSPADQECEAMYQATTTRTPSGRYIVDLPFKMSPPVLGDSYQLALRRFALLERKFARDPDFKHLYVEFMDDYLSKGHMTQVKDESSVKYFIPHHGIFKGTGDTRKIRVVFDASAKTSNGRSLNDVLYSGPKLQTLLSDVLSLFRQYAYVFTCDIQQMFRQILVSPSHQTYQAVLWRSSTDQPVQAFQLTTVTYGVTTSPYLALRTLAQLVKDEGHNHPRASQLLSQNIFVDDIVAGANSIPEALSLLQDITALLRRGGFHLRKWSSNSDQILSAIPDADKEPLVDSVFGKTVGLLGMHWSPERDVFMYNIALKPHNSSQPVTKRSVLSRLAQVYDPCGWLSPVLMTAKSFLQQLWLQPVDWDTPLSSELTTQWKSFCFSLSELLSVQVQRPLAVNRTNFSLHGFADASQKGYAAVLYIVNAPHVTLLVSKTRVAPLKQLTIPRLELSGALLLAQLASHYLKLFSSTFEPSRTYLWSDSRIVLEWIRTPPYKLIQFIANRVSQINELTTPVMWRHVPSKDNPADLASRGIHPSAIVAHSLWWSGPPWLPDPPDNWPQPGLDSTPSSINTELRRTETTQAVVPTTSQLFDHVSSWPRLIRIVVFILKWRYRRTPRTTAQYYQLARISICYHIQQTSLGPLIIKLQGKQLLPKQYRRLTPYMDPSGIVRLGGRLVNVQPVSPIILPKRNRLVELLIDHYHACYAHAGTSFLLFQIARQYWIMSARQLIKSRIYKCIRCFRAKPRDKPPLMSMLPEVRSTPSPPFTHTGMDYAGPFVVKLHHLRKSPLIKVYLCVFICFTTKAVHLELVQDLTSAAFLDALRRFSSRRGAPAVLKRQWMDVLSNSTSVAHELAMRQVDFRFNPPASPHHGGLWERAVGSTKRHLTRVLGGVTPTMLQLQALLIRVEAILNSRPLVPMSADPEDLTALTPAHFLIGRSLVGVPEYVPDTASSTLLTKFNLAQALTHQFWARWRAEYLPQLQVRPKWTTENPSLQVGDLVVVNEPNLPPLSWPLARVTAIHPGSDKVVRSATVRTDLGEYKRPAVKLYRLPSNH